MGQVGKSFLGEFGDKQEQKPPAPVVTPATVVDDKPPVVPIVDDKPPVVSTPPVDDKAPPTPPIDGDKPPVETPKLEINDDSLKAYFKEKYGKDVEDVGNLFKEPDAPVDQLEGVSDEMKAYLKFHKETNGRSFEEFNSLNRDFTKLSPLDIAREKAYAYTKGKVSKDDVDEFLEKKLNVDLSDIENIEKFDLIELERFGEDYVNEQLANKEKYKTPKEKPLEEDMVTLEGGAQISRKAFDNATNKRNQYVESIEASADKITAASFKVKIDDNGTEKTVDLNVDYSKDDLHNMKSHALNIDKAFAEMFGDKDGVINPVALQEGLSWANPANRGKYIQKLHDKIRADLTQEFLNDEHNIPLNRNKMPSNNKGGKTVPIPGQQTNYGVKYDFN
jgi:hypothetical protein